MKKYTQEEERRRQRRRVVQMMLDNTLNVDSTGSKVTAHDLNQRILKAVVLKKDKEGVFFSSHQTHQYTLHTYQSALELPFVPTAPLATPFVRVLSLFWPWLFIFFKKKGKKEKERREERKIKREVRYTY